MSGIAGDRTSLYARRGEFIHVLSYYMNSIIYLIVDRVDGSITGISPSIPTRMFLQHGPRYLAILSLTSNLGDDGCPP